MKKTLVSLAAVAALTTGAMAADKGIELKTTGQTVLYYNTLGNNAAFSTGGKSLFTSDGGAAASRANFGIQLNLDADLKNGFTLGSTINYLGTAGLEKNLVNGVMQSTDGTAGTVTGDKNIADEIYLSQLYIAKKMANTTLKIGRQELPKSLSPFAFSEGWNVFKNTFDAILAVNTDIPDTAIVGAFVADGNGNGFGHNMSSFEHLRVNNDSVSGNGGINIGGAAYMLTAQNKSIPMTTVTASYYNLIGIQAGEGKGADVLWADALVAGKDMPLGLKVGLQGGQINPRSNGLDSSTAFGLKVGMVPMESLSLCLAYSSVNDGTAAIQNVGGIKTPLYTQMIANQKAIALDSNTMMLKGVYNTGDNGKIILQGSMSDTGKKSLWKYNKGTVASPDMQGSDLLEIDLVYKVKAAGINWLAAYISQDFDKDKGTTKADHNDIIRFVARYNF